MASPPTKRQRTSKVVLSDDEEEEPGTARQGAISLRSTRLPVSSSGRGLASQQSGKSAVQRSKHKPNKDTSNATSPKAVLKTDSPSPHKPKKSPRKKKTEDNSKSLDAFFSRVSEEQRWNRKTEPATKEIDDVETGDAIEDDNDSLDEAFSQLAEGQGDVKFQLDRRKDKATLSKNGTQTFRKALPASSHKFVKPPTPNVNRNNIKVETERNSSLYLHRPWADRYGPANLEELAVHKKKVVDVQKWLGEVLDRRDPRVCAIPNIIASSLVLTGS
jgi:cell cycle checkpoint protein